jgi:succinate dehydrogenase / fumarate reductase cytochrome b subunit
MLGGARHLIWDTGMWMDKKAATNLAWATIAGSLVLTLLVWIIAYAIR